jgi:hypothetical protein
MAAFGLIVVMFDVLKNGLRELANAGEGAAAQTLLRQISKTLQIFCGATKKRELSNRILIAVSLSMN